MTFVQPTSWPEALEARATHPEAIAVAGGTDVLVELNFDRLRPTVLLDLSRVRELSKWGREDGHLRVGAGVTYHELIANLAPDLPALAMAARTVGSPPIRNRGTIGGNLGSASPAGDCHPPLLAAGAEVEVASARRSRTVPISEFFIGPKRNVLAEDELIAAVWVPAASGPQVFAKVGVRNAMVIAACSFALALHPDRHRVGTGIGSAGPVPLQALAAQSFLEDHLEEVSAWESKASLADSVSSRFGELVAEAARPIDDVRASAAYRRRALAVLGRRALSWCWTEYRAGRA
ncbi:MAG TPA: FAD binding domain-containing protein [Acidimicrobiales bacterium]|nr:FAD binding domain-containing protein [Acidimicrobiales bacterium]